MSIRYRCQTSLVVVVEAPSDFDNDYLSRTKTRDVRIVHVVIKVYRKVSKSFLQSSRQTAVKAKSRPMLAAISKIMYV